MFDTLLPEKSILSAHPWANMASRRNKNAFTFVLNSGKLWMFRTWFGPSIRRLGPSIYRSLQKNIRNFKHPKKIFKILSTPKNIPTLYLDLKKEPKMHRNDPQTSPIL